MTGSGRPTERHPSPGPSASRWRPEMKPAPFDYAAPTELEEAIELVGRHGSEARPLAGGQSLVPLLNFRLARPALIVDLNRIQSLAYHQAGNECLVVGALCRQRDVEVDRDAG